MDNRKKRVERLKIIITAVPLIMVLLPLMMNLFLFFELKEFMGLEGRLHDFHEAVLLYQADAPDENHEYTLGEESPQSHEVSSNSLLQSSFDEPEDSGENHREEQQDYSTGEVVREVYLTFDDGPSPYTEEILDILDEYGVKATFFVTATQIPGYEDICRRIVDEGHGLGIHTYNHVYSDIYASLEHFQRDIRRIQNYLYRLTGRVVMIYRFPGGSSNRVSKVPVEEMIAWLEEEGMVYYDWNVLAGDAGQSRLSAQEIAENCLLGIRQHNPAVVLLHDAYDKRSTIEALPLIIEGISRLEDTVLLPLDKETVPIQHISITKE